MKNIRTLVLIIVMIGAISCINYRQEAWSYDYSCAQSYTEESAITGLASLTLVPSKCLTVGAKYIKVALTTATTGTWADCTTDSTCVTCGTANEIASSTDGVCIYLAGTKYWITWGLSGDIIAKIESFTEAAACTTAVTAPSSVIITGLSPYSVATPATSTCQTLSSGGTIQYYKLRQTDGTSTSLQQYTDSGCSTDDGTLVSFATSAACNAIGSASAHGAKVTFEVEYEIAILEEYTCSGDNSIGTGTTTDFTTAICIKSNRGHLDAQYYKFISTAATTGDLDYCGSDETCTTCTGTAESLTGLTSSTCTVFQLGTDYAEVKIRQNPIYYPTITFYPDDDIDCSETAEYTYSSPRIGYDNENEEICANFGTEESPEYWYIEYSDSTYGYIAYSGTWDSTCYDYGDSQEFDILLGVGTCLRQDGYNIRVTHSTDVPTEQGYEVIAEDTEDTTDDGETEECAASAGILKFAMSLTIIILASLAF